MNRGSTVQKVPSRTAYSQMRPGRSSAESGSSAKNCTTAGSVATAMEYAVKRIDPTRFTSSALTTR